MVYGKFCLFILIYYYIIYFFRVFPYLFFSTFLGFLPSSLKIILLFPINKMYFYCKTLFSFVSFFSVSSTFLFVLSSIVPDFPFVIVTFSFYSFSLLKGFLFLKFFFLSNMCYFCSSTVMLVANIARPYM